MVLDEIMHGFSLTDIKNNTEADFILSPQLKEI